MHTQQRRILPLVGATGTGSFTTCRYKCGSACFHAPPNRSDNETFEQVVARGVTRRTLLKAGLASLLLGACTPATGGQAGGTPPGGGPTAAPPTPGPGAPATTLGFQPIQPTTDNRVVLPGGYASEILVRWGDPVLADAPEFNFDLQTPESQAGQFGYNNDFVSYVALDGAERGLLWVNHEYTNPELMFRGYDLANPTPVQVQIQLEAHGGSLIEVRRRAGESRLYERVPGGQLNRRITGTTPMEVAGPAAGHPLLRTAQDPSGTRVLGMLNNCAGGQTPWGTILTCEENFDQYFGNLAALADLDETRRTLHERYGIEEPDTGDSGESERLWERVEDRFDLGVTPNEPFRFGYVVEVDPLDPASTPRKHTALGRFKHEGATTSATADGRIAVYMGDDERFDYVYKFVSAERQSDDRETNLRLLDSGTLYAARFDADGAGRWLPLVAGQGPLTAANGFPSQAEVCVATRLAADLAGATKMDRPEDVARDPVSGRVYVNLTNNDERVIPVDPQDSRAEGPTPPNPRAPNNSGHVIELVEDGDDAAAETFRWEILLLAGSPDDPSTYFAGYPKEQVSPIASPDNMLFDGQGNIWLATDGQPDALGFNDAFHAVPLDGTERGHVQQFLSVPAGAEACGPEFAPDLETLFCAVQHPGEDGALEGPGQISDWPDGGGLPPRPSVIMIEKMAGNGGRRIGT